MDTLQIHDSFEPYFAGKSSFAPTATEPKVENEAARRVAVQRLRRERQLPVRLADIRSVQATR